MAVAEFAAGMGGIKTALEIIQGIKNSLDPTISKAQIVGFQDALIKAQTELIDANLAHMAQVQLVYALEKKVRNFETWDTEKKRHELKDLGWGAFAFMLKPDARGTEPPHWVCANCFHKGEIAIIQDTFGSKGSGRGWYCPRCGAQIKPKCPKPTWDWAA